MTFKDEFLCLNPLKLLDLLERRLSRFLSMLKMALQKILLDVGFCWL